MLPIFTITFAAMLAFLGLLFDGGRIYFEKRRMQVAADAAAFGGAHELLRSNDEATIVSGGRDDAALNSFTHGQDTVNVQIKHPPDSGSRLDDTRCVEAEIDQNIPTTLMRIVGTTTPTVAARAVACMEIYDDEPCVLALYCGDAKPGLEIEGTANLSADDCNVVVNSKSTESISIGGTGGGCPMLETTGEGMIAYGTGGGVVQSGGGGCVSCDGCAPPDYEPENNILCMKDPYCSNYLANTSPGYPGDPLNTTDYPLCDPMPDPWDPNNPPTPDFNIPIIDDINYNDGVTFPACGAPITAPCFDGTAVQLPAGYYGGEGIRLNGGVANLVCNDSVQGCLFLVDQFRMNGGSITGTGVAVYITPVGNRELAIGGNAGTPPDTINLASATGGTYDNVLFFNSRYASKSCTVIGGSAMFLDGAIYCPTGHLKYGGGSAYDANTGFTAIIADTINISGNPGIGLNYAGAGRAPRTRIVALVE